MDRAKVVKFEDYSEGFDHDFHGKSLMPILPRLAELNQAVLRDDMPVLAPAQLNSTGKSVSRSYDAIGDPNDLAEDKARYLEAMSWLNYRDHKESKSRVEIYDEKQKEYTKIVEQKAKAYNDAHTRAISDPLNETVEKQKAAYNLWVSENARTYRHLIQTAYMEWVVTGMKEEVEHWFAVVQAIPSA